MERWGFEEDDDERDERPARDDDNLTGQDVDGIVTVTVDDGGDVRSVRLADGWQEEFRRGLGAKVVEAVTAATTRAMATPREATVADVPDAPDGPLTSDDVLRLLHEVSSDLGRFRQRLSAVADETVRVTSGGGHVTVSGRRRQVADVSLDQEWLYGARASEVEGELREALRAFGDRSSPGELAAGPVSDAISELRALVADPQGLVRRIRQGSTL